MNIRAALEYSLKGLSPDQQRVWIWVIGQKQIQQIDRELEGLCYFYLRDYRNREGMEACQPGT